MTSNTFAQTEDYFTPASDSSYDFSLNEGTQNNTSHQLSSDKIKLHPMLQMGSSVYSHGNSNMFSSYVSPSLRVDPPGKFSMSIGTSMIFSDYMTNLLPESKENSYFEKMATYQMYASGSYQVNKNLNIRGGASLTLLPGSDSESLKNGHIGFDYSIGDNAHIQADFNFGDATPYYSPFGYNTHNINSHMSFPGFNRGSRGMFIH
ncbi:MAG: hypothetical protein ACQES1_00565 [Bacteroidota bacterium]